MEILRWQVGNALKNYQYVIYDNEKNAVILDPLDGDEVTRLAAKFQLKIKAILVTHEHADHVGDAVSLSARYGVSILTSAENVTRFEFNSTASKGILNISRELAVRFHETPGHTAGHVAFEINGFFFSGDCLFQGGCGHCRTPGSDIAEHYTTLNFRIKAMSPDLILMPGHYYAARNLNYALHVEPDNARARDLLSRIKTEADESNHQTTLRDEGDYNPFMRLASKSLRSRLGAISGRDFLEATDLTVFTELRRLRDDF